MMEIYLCYHYMWNYQYSTWYSILSILTHKHPRSPTAIWPNVANHRLMSPNVFHNFLQKLPMSPIVAYFRLLSRQRWATLAPKVGLQLRWVEMNWVKISWDELCSSVQFGWVEFSQLNRTERSEVEADNIYRGLNNSCYHAKAESNNCFIIHLKTSETYKKIKRSLPFCLLYFI